MVDSVVRVLHVRLHMHRLRESRLTEETNKWLLPPVNRVEVSFQIGGRDEPVATLAARERPHPTVGHLVLAQVCQLLEPLLASLPTLGQVDTMVRLFSSVNSLVGYQVALLVKIFLTDLTLVFALPILLWSLLLLSDFQKVVKLLFEMRDGEGLPSSGDHNQVTR